MMFIENIDYHNIASKINLLDKNLQDKNNIDTNNFTSYLKTALDDISNIQNKSKKDSENFLLNESETSLNDVMINFQKSSIAIKMAVQIRNKLVSAYQDIMNQQV